MAAVNESDVAGLELERVRTKLPRAFEYEGKFFSSIEKRDVEKISHRQMRLPIALRPGGSFQYFDPDGGDLGRGGGPTYDKAVVQSVFFSENMEYTKLAQWATNSNRKAIADAIRRQTATAMDELRRQIDAQLQGTGNGVVGTISAVATAGGVDTYTLNSDGFGARRVRFGQEVQVFDTTLATLRGSATITFHDTENKTINVTPAVAGAVATDLLVVKGITDPTALPGLFGVPYHHSNASTGTWLGFARSSTPEVRSSRVNAGGAALTLPLPRLAVNKVGNRVDIDGIKMEAWTHPAQKHAYEEIGQTVINIEKTTSDEGLNMYFGDNMQLAGVKLRCTYNWNPTRIDYIVKSTWGRGEILPIGFYKVDNRRIFEIRGASGGVTTADIFYLVCGMQTFVDNPASTVYIDNLAVPTGY